MSAAGALLLAASLLLSAPAARPPAPPAQEALPPVDAADPQLPAAGDAASPAAAGEAQPPAGAGDPPPSAGAGERPAEDGEPVFADPPPGLVVAGPETPVLLGEPFSVLVRGPGSLAQVELRPDEERLPDDALRPGEIERRRVGNEVEFRVPLQAAREGRFELPLVARTDDGRLVRLPALAVEVVLDLPPDRAPRLSARLPPLAVPLPAAAGWPFAAAAFAWLAALGTWLVWSSREHVVVEPEPPPDEVALAALARLRAALPATPDEMLPFSVALGDVLRTYVEQRFGLHAPARTTEEFLVEAGRRQDAVGSRREHLQRFLQQCDLVKYARHRPDPSAALALLATVEEFVAQTRAPQEEPGDGHEPAAGDGRAPSAAGAPAGGVR